MELVYPHLAPGSTRSDQQVFHRLISLPVAADSLRSAPSFSGNRSLHIHLRSSEGIQTEFQSFRYAFLRCEAEVGITLTVLAIAGGNI